MNNLAMIYGDGAAAKPPALHRLKDGAQVRLDDSSVEVRDSADRLLIRYVDGHAEVTAATGDLRFTAPQGKVMLSAKEGVALVTEGELLQRADRVVMQCERLEVDATESSLTTECGKLVAERITTVAEQLHQRVEYYELTAARLVERTRDSFREVSGLLQQRAGRVRCVVEGGYHLLAGRTAIRSKKETSIDGSKVLLG